MENQLIIYNTLSRKKEVFKPLIPGYVGMYVCGPTVYGKAHLGHARPAITFDLLFRYLKFLGYKVRYVRNITDVGHLVADADEGEDKVAKKAKLEQLEPMEVVQMYTHDYHKNMDLLNVQPPSIEPRASGHILEQIETVQKILDSGYAYESNGSIYFNVQEFAEKHEYGQLSGRKVEDLLSNTRELDGQEEKKSPLDFAIWKKAQPEHIMRWHSPWGDGFPGWHLECSAMSTKYLGKEFDIHGGGMDLTFPHHEAEMAQSKVANGKPSVQYWMHNNMITLNGQKMGKSLGNAISLDQFFSGTHELLEKPYSPMTIRFFMLQAHYRGTLDFSNGALQAAEKGYARLMKAMETLEKLPVGNNSTVDVAALKEKVLSAMNDDLNSPIAIAHLFDAVKMVNSINDGTESIAPGQYQDLKAFLHVFLYDVLGFEKEGKDDGPGQEAFNSVVDLLLNLRVEAKANKDWATADKIRDRLTALGFEIKDTKDGFEWDLK